MKNNWIKGLARGGQFYWIEDRTKVWITEQTCIRFTEEQFEVFESELLDYIKEKFEDKAVEVLNDYANNNDTRYPETTMFVELGYEIEIEVSANARCYRGESSTYDYPGSPDEYEVDRDSIEYYLSLE